ncbi:MAG: 3-phosphoshikimate 1-carboxyvinyltransferase, partial [Vallitaleaceae bacterium]|nr:3-phosphoshikimate 1-carboxyvinyltransferase [Vallitaleaceae bacterium]
MTIKPVKSLKGTLTVPGDKSISHRSIMFGALSKGSTKVSGFLMGADCLSTIDCFRKLGVTIDVKDDLVTIHGVGLHGLKKPTETLDVGNSGTTMRIMSGILSGQTFETRLTGDDSIKSRPMGRIIKPLTQMGSLIRSEGDNDKAPLVISPSKTHAIAYESPVASAQIKSSIIMANLYTNEVCVIKEPALSRNHTEIMLNYFGGHIESVGTRLTAHPIKELYAKDIQVPGDISSAAYFLVAGLIIPNSDITLYN